MRSQKLSTAADADSDTGPEQLFSRARCVRLITRARQLCAILSAEQKKSSAIKMFRCVCEIREKQDFQCSRQHILSFSRLTDGPLHVTDEAITADANHLYR